MTQIMEISKTWQILPSEVIRLRDERPLEYRLLFAKLLADNEVARLGSQDKIDEVIEPPKADWSRYLKDTETEEVIKLKGFRI